MARSAGRVLLAALIIPLMCSLALSPSVAAQDSTDIVVPDDVQDFWKRWLEAKDQPTDEEMDRTVRRYTEDAEFMLNVLLDDISRKEVPALHHEIRLLAWALDRVEKTERYISRARFVFDLDMVQRRQRSSALAVWAETYDGEEQARRLRTDSAWSKVLNGYDKAIEQFSGIEDWEYVVFCLVRQSTIQGERELRWEQSRILKQIVEVAGRLSFEDPALEESRKSLDILAEHGIDPDGERPADEPERDQRGGLGLEAFADGAEKITVPLELVNPKKGLPNISYPWMYTIDQYQLWPITWIEGQGPEDFDYTRGARFQPYGEKWILTRDGPETFMLDRDGDGEPELSFGASTTPSRIVVPGVDGHPDIAFMVATPGQREPMFDLELNYAPTNENARMRFLAAYHFEAEVLGETWQLFDLNMDGGIAYHYETVDDTITVYSDSSHIEFCEPDGLLVGKGKRALPWSSVVPVGDAFYRTWADDPRAYEIQLQELNLATGEVQVEFDTKVPPSTLIVQEVSELLPGAFFEILPERRGKTVRLPVGTYRIAAGRMEKGKKTSQDAVRIYTGNSEPFEVKEDEVTKLEFGAPFKLTFETRGDSNGRVIDGRSIRVFGRGGEEYAMFFDRALQPEIRMQNAAGKKTGKPVNMRKTDITAWQEDMQGNIVWFPMDEAIEVPSGESWQFQLYQKAHVLLGGPLESDWTP